MNRLAAITAMVVPLAWPAVLHAEDPQLLAKINGIKVEIIEAENIQKKFSAALKHCHLLDGKNFYMQNQDRILNVEQYHKSLENLVKDRVFNPQKKGPWTGADAEDRLKVVEKMAEHDKYRCEIVAKLPALQKELMAFDKEH
jgi:hypothetical protein